MKIRHGIIIAGISYVSSLAALYAWSKGMSRDLDVIRWVKTHW